MARTNFVALLCTLSSDMLRFIRIFHQNVAAQLPLVFICYGATGVVYHSGLKKS